MKLCGVEICRKVLTAAMVYDASQSFSQPQGCGYCTEMHLQYISKNEEGFLCSGNMRD